MEAMEELYRRVWIINEKNMKKGHGITLGKFESFCSE